MIQFGARRDVCVSCQQHDVCGDFWVLAPVVRLFLCAACLRRAAAAVEQATPIVLARERAKKAS